MQIQKIESIACRLPLKQPFVTSYGQLNEKAFDIIRITAADGTVGMGELVAFEEPDYIEETIFSARQVIREQLIPLVTGATIAHPDQVAILFSVIQGNAMAKSAIETAIWDLYAKQSGYSMADVYPSIHNQIPVGVSVGIQPTIGQLLAQVEQYVAQGYQRIKLKIKPGNDRAPLLAIRERFPEVLLMADANGAYVGQEDVLLTLDTLGLAMIEQPLKVRDLTGHAALQKKMQTPLCLDEDIRCVEDIATVAVLGSCQAINLKIPRVGGISEAQKIVKACKDHGLTVWLGGMFESGVGRAMNLQFASQAGFDFPGDLSAADRYYFDDIVAQPAVIENGCLSVPKGKGFGVSLAEEKLIKYGESPFVLFEKAY
ncbi:MAG TPA: o-succinylbenzoate synthase [Enterococcus sp.]|nr:o-succinylbenzoate synthase [Enterococcus sp.]